MDPLRFWGEKKSSLTRLKKPEHFGQFWQFDMLRKEAHKKNKRRTKNIHGGTHKKMFTAPYQII